MEKASTDPVVSVVVPVYQAEKYLQRCVESLQNQTLKDIEIVLVDDGSPDCCPELCDHYARMDSRIRVVHQRNGGLSSARNAGMRAATGKFIGFVDADDDVDPKMYACMAEVLTSEKVDFVMSDYLRIPSVGKPFLKTLSMDAGLYQKDKIRSVIYPQLIMGESLEYGPLLSVWHCLYSAAFLKRYRLRFDEEVRWSEDNIFSAIAGYCAESFYYLKGKGLYHYYQNSGTITTGYRKGCWPVYCRMNEHLHDFFDHVGDYDFSRQLKLHLIYYACNSLGQIPHSGEPEKVQSKMIREIMDTECLREAFHNFSFPRCWSWKLKLQVSLIKHRKAWLYGNLIQTHETRN